MNTDKGGVSRVGGAIREEEEEEEEGGKVGDAGGAPGAITVESTEEHSGQLLEIAGNTRRRPEKREPAGSNGEERGETVGDAK